MKFIVQLVNHNTGARSVEFMTDADQFANILRDVEGLDHQDHILVLASINLEAEDAENQFQFMYNPIVTIESFLAATPEQIDHPNKLNGNPPEEPQQCQNG